ncbi:PREDICTED: leucine-rich PPR motif-containing protein, mitochondrial-like [Cyphomyrmex costatus]|uniref:Leucine-rich PPR motif-containing protein, mitochondrial n=1 Tax=Cyphomyrmex costatus TaxID=456900 RepID=A0A151IMQ0_9HYME|nr:PREDICTED: leucine-rich PPR motif-containing protein, mitochondrial-like [Cyphomyrmex costatus]KYN06229.1 Leucine-rich PPR motif-containing protein, mitochondrial [Cyphomyrmex costatus]
MIEIDKVLYLRRYLIFLGRSQLHLSRCGITNRSSQCGGYVLEYMHPRNLRPEIYIAACNRTYSTTVPQSSQSDIVDHKLMSFCDDIKKGRVSADGLKEVINLCNKNNYQLPQDVGILLLKCCGNLLCDLEATERDNLAGQVWRLAKKNDGTISLEYYNTLLGVNEDNSLSVNPKKFLENMSVEPDENTYRLLLNIATKTNNSEHLWDILSVTKDKNVTIYEEAVNALVRIYMTKNDIVKVEQMITLMREVKLPTTKAYGELACGYARVGDIPNLIKILNEEPQDNVNLLRIIKILSISNNSRHIPVVLNFLMTSVPMLQTEIFKMITELIRANQVADAQTIINCIAMNDAVTKEITQSFVNSFMNELIILNAPIDNIIKYANDFVESGCNQALLDVAEIGLKLGREKLCFAIFDVMRQKKIEIRPHYYWPLLITAYNNKGEAEIYSLVKSMVNTDVKIDSDTLLHYIYPYVNTTDPVITLQKLLLSGVEGDIIFTPLLSFLLQQNRLQDLVLLCTSSIRYKVYYKELMKPLVHAYFDTKDFKTCVLLLTTFPQGHDFVGTLLKSLIKIEYPIYIEDLQLLLDELKIYEIKISQFDANILKNRLKKNKNFNLTPKVITLIDNLVDSSMKDLSIMSHLKYMNTKELTYYLVELKNSTDSVYKDRIKFILQKMLISYCFENNIKKVEEIKQEYDACQYEWTPNMKSILFELYVKNDKLNEAEALLPELQIMPNKFQIDRMKIVMYATALVKANKLTKAFDIINTLNIIDFKVDAQKYCCILLQTLAQSQYHDRTKDMLNLLLEKNYCQVTMELLKPLVAMSLKRNILEAVDVLSKCAQKFHKMPLILEVLILLLEQKYSSKLHDADNWINHVYDIINTIYSEQTANTILAIALATLNKTEKLQILLQNNTLSMNCLMYYLNNVESNSIIDGLQNILEVTDAIHVNQNMMCEALLSAYNKMGDCNRALELWNIMCTKNIKPSKQFEKNFIPFLLSNKMSLPPELDRIKIK